MSESGSSATATAAKPEATFFSLKTPLLAQGRFDNRVARTDLMTMIVKVYASGGENAMHQHLTEDHSFIVLEGQATFHIGTDDNIHVCNKYEGVMLPKGACYWFQSSAPENLVMLRAGASTSWPKDDRAFPDGRPFEGHSVENKREEMIPLSGRYFAG